MTKSKTIEELIKILLEDISLTDEGDKVYVKIHNVQCVMKYKDEFKNIDALKVPNLRKKLEEKEIYGETLKNLVENYKNMLNKFKNAGYKIKKHDSFGPHRLRTIE